MGQTYSEFKKYIEHLRHSKTSIPAHLMKKIEDRKWMRFMYSLAIKYENSHPPESTMAYRTAQMRYKFSTLCEYDNKSRTQAINDYLLRVWDLNATQDTYEQLMGHLEFKRRSIHKDFCLECEMDYLKNEHEWELDLNGSKVLCPPLHVNLWALHLYLSKPLLATNIHSDPDPWDIFGRTSMLKVCRELYNIYQRDDDPCNREMNLLKLLIEKKASVNACERSNRHPIFQILSCNMYNVLISDETEETIHARTIMSGLEYQLDVYAKVFFRDRIAAEAIELMLKKKVDPNVKDNRGNSLLSLAVSYLNYNVVKLLLGYGADPKSVSFAGGYFHSNLHILLSFELVQNLVDIIRLLKMNEYELTFEDKLNILNFIVEHKYIARYHNIGALLALASPQLIRQNSNQVFNRYVYVQHDENYRDIIIKRHLMIEKYVLAVKAGKMYRQDEGLFQEICQDCSDNDHPNLVSNIEHEIEEATNTMLSETTSLLDVCQASPDDALELFIGTNYLDLLTSEDFNSRFPELKLIIKGYFAKALIRDMCVIWGADFLKHHYRQRFSYLNCINVMRHLSNEKILDFCRASVRTIFDD